MALQVWLPLNGNLDNQGLSNITVTNNGATVNDNGKIGKCYSFNGSSQYIDFSSYASQLRELSEVSICFWCYISNASSNKLFCIRDNKGRHQLSLNSKEFSFRDTSNEGGNLRVISNTITVNTWTHIAICYKSGSLYIYKNGELSNSYRSSSQYKLNSGISDFFIGRNVASSGTTYLNGKLNDFRIYDHALSLKEVKEISKGLVLHYKLDGNDISITIPRNGGLIPDGLELYDYIQSSGTQWIDTGYIPKGDFGTEIKFQLTQTQSFTTIWGSMPSSSQITPRTGFHNCPKTKWMAGINTTSYFGTADTNVHTLKQTFNNGTETMILDKSQVYTGSPGATALSSNNLSIGLFARNQNPVTNYTSMKCYYFSINNGSTLVRNLLPCTYLGEPGMWDTVENKFYKNQGTGQFTLGNKITLKEYEYLQSASSGWINTNYIPTFNTKVKTKINIVSNSAAAFAFGSRIGVSNQAYYAYYGGTFRNTWAYSANTLGNLNGQETNRLAEIEYSIPYIKINNYIFNTNQTTFNGSKAIYLFGINTNGSMDNQRGTEQIYYFQLYENNQLVRDFIPVSYNGTPGLWDRVEWKFYANAGSGNFTLGSEKTVQQDVPVLYDSSGYCNNGMIVGNVSIDLDTPRYNKSLVIQSSSTITHQNTLSNDEQEWTCCAWIKPLSLPNYSTLNNFNLGNRLVHGTYPLLYINNGINDFYTYGNKAIVTDEWQHVAFVFKNGTVSGSGTTSDAIKLIYINGVNQTGKGLNKTNTPFGIPDNVILFGGDFSGNVSDYREYCTALSEEDIKELYNTSAIVDNQGNDYAYQFNELMENIELNSPLNSFKQTSGSVQFDGKDLILTGESASYSDYIEVDVSKTLFYDITYSNTSGSRFLIGFERYDENKTITSNRGCIYVKVSIYKEDHKRITGTLTLSNINGNVCKFTKIRILNCWTNSTVEDGVGKIHSFHFIQISGDGNSEIDKQGKFTTGWFMEDELLQSQISKNKYVTTNQLIEI